jgi:cytidine deaminase
MSSTEPSKKSLRPHLNDETRHALIEAAQGVRQHAYAPYSNYLVGAALLTSTGNIYAGCNIENAAFSPTLCAERVAVAKAVSEGVREFEAIAVVTDNGGFPCGLCRQTLYEFSPLMVVIVVDPEGNIINESSLAELLPRGFSPDQVPKHGTA